MGKEMPHFPEQHIVAG